jgi:CheY-like chemotaxis protein
MTERPKDRVVEILLVEDNPMDVELTSEALMNGPVPANVRVASDGEEALARLRRQGEFADAPRPDLILLDLNLPRLGGHEVLAAIKSDDRLRRIPVVVLTSSQAEQDIAASYDRHANCFVTKPVELRQYLQAVKGIEQFWLGLAKLPGGGE